MARDLKLGLNTGYWSAGPPAGIEDAVAEADRLGFDSIWTAEAYGSDVLTPLAWWGAKTENVRLGTAIMQMSARQPAAAAMAAMTMDHLSGGASSWGWACPGRRWSRAGTAVRSRSRWRARAST
jgi:alkanesulfonate monooxygenase SsuD/methylene tetrahydromethanopterin reductase-like flavin-dependent oxidoreductase (luciferase family)